MTTAEGAKHVKFFQNTAYTAAPGHRGKRSLPAAAKMCS